MLTGKWAKAPISPAHHGVANLGFFHKLEDALVVQALDNADVVATQNMFDDANASDVVDQLLEAHK